MVYCGVLWYTVVYCVVYCDIFVDHLGSQVVVWFLDPPAFCRFIPACTCFYSELFALVLYLTPYFTTIDIQKWEGLGDLITSSEVRQT